MWITIIMVNTSFSGVRFWLKVLYKKTWVEVSCCFAFEILRKLILTSGCDPLSLSFTTRDTTTVLFESQLTSCKTKIVTIDWSLSSDQCHVCEVHSAYRIPWIKYYLDSRKRSMYQNIIPYLEYILFQKNKQYAVERLVKNLYKYL